MRVFIVVTAVTVGLAVVALGSAGGTAIPAGNLVKNPGAEANFGGDFYTRNIAPNSWTKLEGAQPYGAPIQVIRYGPDGRIPDVAVAKAIGGGKNFFGGGYPSSVSGAFQIIDVPGAASEIDSGVLNACLSAYLGGAQGSQARARIVVEFTGEGDARLGQLQAGPVTTGHRKDMTTMLRRAAQSAVPRNTRQFRVTITAESGGGPSNYSSADNISVALTKGNCEPVLVVKCVKKALVATVNPSAIAKTQRVRFAVKGGKRTKTAQDARAPYTGRFTMDGLTGKLKVTATVQQAGSGSIVLTKNSKRC